MKVLFHVVMAVILLVFSTVLVVLAVSSDYQYNQRIQSYWSLADKASSLDVKSEYIDKFVSALEKEKFSEYNATFLKTPNNSFEQNLKAVKTLQSRLKNISKMDENSFAYQTAIQQITAQEQGEAREMLTEIQGCWYLANYPIFWNWLGCVLILGGILVFVTTWTLIGFAIEYS